MASFTISTLAGRVLAELPLDDATLHLVVGDLLERLPPLDGAGVPRLLLGPRELGVSERLADLALAPGTAVTLVLVQDPKKAATDLLGTEGAAVRLKAARALGAMGAAAAGQADAALSAVLSDPDAAVVGEALQALRAMGEAVQEQPAGARWAVEECRRLAQIAQDLEDPTVLGCVLHPSSRDKQDLVQHLSAILERCDASAGQAALRRRTVLRRLAALDPGAARCHEPVLADPLADHRPKVRLARVAVLASKLMGQSLRRQEDAAGELCDVLQGDACLAVRRRAAAALGSGPALPTVALARAALATELRLLQKSRRADRRTRMADLQSLQKLLG